MVPEIFPVEYGIEMVLAIAKEPDEIKQMNVKARFFTSTPLADYCYSAILMPIGLLD
jgi:hypothetical protein